MASSRTVKSLSALFVAMTLGALVLMALETEPIRPLAQASLAVVSPPPAGAALAVYETTQPLDVGQWRHIVVHAAPASSDPLARQCHFQIRADGHGGWQVASTAYWRRQRPGGHVGGYWERMSIGVCLIGDFSQRPPDGRQFGRLVELVNTLQEVCDIAADRVYLHRDLVAASTSPGAAFPNAAFSARLIRTRR